MFDVNAMLDQTFTEANSTESLPIPVGEYVSIIDKVELRPWTSKKDPSLSGLALDVTYSIDDAGVKEILNRQKVTVRQGIMLELTEDQKSLDFGKGRNVQLGRLRAAVNLNDPGVPFNMNSLVGRMAKVKVGHRVEGDIIYSEVQGVVSATA